MCFPSLLFTNLPTGIKLLLALYMRLIAPCLLLVTGGVSRISQWRHNKRDGVSSHRRLDCLLNRLFRRRSKKISKLRVTGFCDRWRMDSLHKGPVTRKIFPFDDVVTILRKYIPYYRPVVMGIVSRSFSTRYSISLNALTIEQTIKLFPIWNALKLMWRHNNNIRYILKCPPTLVFTSLLTPTKLLFTPNIGLTGVKSLICYR